MQNEEESCNQNEKKNARITISLEREQREKCEDLYVKVKRGTSEVEQYNEGEGERI